MSTSAGEDVAGACCGLCCICCSEGFIDWLQLTRCCPGSSTQAGCCGPCCKGSFDSKDDWVEQERARRQRDTQAHAGADTGVVNAQPVARASMEAGRLSEPAGGSEAQPQVEQGAPEGNGQGGPKVQ